MKSRRNEALALSEELLADIELSRIESVAMVRKANRLARLLDDAESLTWLSFEIGGYIGNSSGLSSDEWEATRRSGRRYFKTVDGRRVEHAYVASLSSLQSTTEASKIRLQHSEATNVAERNDAQKNAVTSQGVIDGVIGAVYLYVSQMYQELRFGSAVETAFENVRDRVDSAIASLVPAAIPMLTTALENAQTDDPEQWKNAAKACRDLVHSTADALRPAGPDVGSRKMGQSNYINRLVDWIVNNAISSTKAAIIKSDLEHLGKRLDAAADGGNKGAHNEVSKEDASRFIVGTYILMGDILELADEKLA